MRYVALPLLLCALVPMFAFAQPPQQTAAGATPVERLVLPPGFTAELLYSVPEAQGSWVSLAVDGQGRLIASAQYGNLYRITPPDVGTDLSTAQVESLEVDMGMAHGLLYAFDSLYAMVNGGRERASGLYRLRDTDGDDQFDDVTLLRQIEGAGEHGPHSVILSPDGQSLYIAAGNHTELPEIASSRVPRNWDEDQLLPRMWDARGHAVGRLAPGGWIAKTDPDAQALELVSIGFRNQYDIALNPAGELFTFDADMEWDIGTPWYRPTRVNHVTSGSEFGWRSGTGKWPSYYPDSLPAVVDVGPGSPTGIVFGTGAKFPAKYQRALFIGDWSYGLIYAAHLEADGSTYAGTLERFVSGMPLPVTDMIIHPQDGALYFAIGGRNTQSGLYRVRYTGEESTAAAESQAEAAADLRKLRHELEAYHAPGHPEAIAAAWPHLSHQDRFIRYAARVAIEHQPVKTWQDQALAEQNPQALILAAIALARNGKQELQPRLIDALGRIQWDELNQMQKLALLRAYGLTFIRLGEPSDELRRETIARFQPHYPAPGTAVNLELSRLLAYLQAPEVVAKTMSLLSSAPTQEEQIHYALVLRGVRRGWNMDYRRAYFQWFLDAAGHRGGMSFGGFLENIRQEAIETLTAEERRELDDVLSATPAPVAAEETATRPLVRKWTVEDLLPEVEKGLVGRDLEQGRQMFAVAACFKCHRFDQQGGISGPDLTAVGRRFNARDLLESIVEPSKTVSDQYQTTTFYLDNGKVVVGRVINLHGNNMMVLTDMLDPSNLTTVQRDQVEQSVPSPTSMMPNGLLDTLTKEEILDLVAYLQSGGEAGGALQAETAGN